jgi:transposase-like protein
MRRRRTTDKRILRCPQCGSPDILPVGGMILGQVYHCPKCDYVGSLVLETDVAEDGTPPDDDV